MCRNAHLCTFPGCPMPGMQLVHNSCQMSKNLSSRVLKLGRWTVDHLGIPRQGRLLCSFTFLSCIAFCQDYSFSPSGISISPILTLTQFLRAKFGTQCGSPHHMFGRVSGQSPPWDGHQNDLGVRGNQTGLGAKCLFPSAAAFRRLGGGGTGVFSCDLMPAPLLGAPLLSSWFWRS